MFSHVMIWQFAENKGPTKKAVLKLGLSLIWQIEHMVITFLKCHFMTKLVEVHGLQGAKAQATFVGLNVADAVYWKWITQTK